MHRQDADEILEVVADIAPEHLGGGPGIGCQAFDQGCQVIIDQGGEASRAFQLGQGATFVLEAQSGDMAFRGQNQAQIVQC